jgi:hypothetical protein
MLGEGQTKANQKEVSGQSVIVAKQTNKQTNKSHLSENSSVLQSII